MADQRCSPFGDNTKMACTLPRTRLAILLFAVVLPPISAIGCHKRTRPLVSDLKLSDKYSERQLLSGFYWLEGNAWRWTTHRFAVVLAVPPGAQTTGATLQLQLYIPDSQIESLGQMTLSADVKDTTLAPETFTKGGSYTYTRTIFPELLNQPVLPIVFYFDKALQGRNSDLRELAAVVSEVSLKQPTGSKG